MSRLTRDGTAEPVSRDQFFRRERGQGNNNFPCSADHEQDWQPYPSKLLLQCTEPRASRFVYRQYVYDQHFQPSMNQPGVVANPARGQLNREKCFFPCPHSRLRIWSRKTGSAVPSRVSLRSSSTSRLNLVLTHGIPPAFRHSVHIYRQPPSGQSRVYQVT